MIFVLPLNQKVEPILERHGLDHVDLDVNVTSRSKDKFKELSPFFLGPCKLADGRKALNMENAWQFSKVYSNHLGRYQNVKKSWLEWSSEGLANARAVRYPMGRGAKPEFSLLGHERLSYIEARKRIYFPLYANRARRTDSWSTLRKSHSQKQTIVLRDFDAYDHRSMKMSLMDVANNTSKPCGHGFVLAMMLEWGETFPTIFKH